MPLSDFQSLCKLHQKVIVSKDKRSKPEHVANNINLCEVYQYKIDGEVIKKGLRCDYLVWNEERRNLYLIELKGSDLDHAVEQLDQTEKELNRRYKEQMNKQRIYYRVVLNRSPAHSLLSNHVKRFMKCHSGNLKWKQGIFEEDI